MELAVGVIVIIGLGLPLTAWWLTRRLARMPLRAFSTGSRAEDWLRDEYGLTWLDRTQIQEAIAQGRRVEDPALRGAARELAARMLAGSLPWPAPRPGLILVASILSASSSSYAVASFAHHHGGVAFVVSGAGYGLLLAAYGWICLRWVPRRQRRMAARARDLNQGRPVAGS